MTVATSEPTAELVLSQLDTHGSIADTRSLAPSFTANPAGVAGAGATTAEAFDSDEDERQFKERQRWQLALQGVLNSLASREMVIYKLNDAVSYALSPEGHQIAREGSHEARLWEALPGKEADKGKDLNELKALLGADTLKVGQARAFRNKWVEKRADGTFVKAVSSIEDGTRLDLLSIRKTGEAPSGDEKNVAELKKRKLVTQRKLVWFSVEKGPKFSTKVEKLETDLTVDMMQSGFWKNATFKKYNFEAEGAPTNGGALHPLLKVREEFKNIFFEMGFTEMPTNKFVENSFWCFDSLFVPQQHPARELQDTFFIRDPPAAKALPEDYLKRVTEVHEKGGHGSIGYRYPFKRAETEKLVLRTHTTAVSSAMLYEIANRPGGFKPSKLFSIDRVFRNEAVDATHLAEFHQVEGVVADYNITLGDLIGFMEVFFAKMGVTNLRFKPAYNPYTEPSLEIFSYHEGLKKWVEIGNSGMFRPEMLQPMGLPPNVQVLGWGLSLERPTMIRYGLNNIRDLVGHKVAFDNIQRSAAVRF